MPRTTPPKRRVTKEPPKARRGRPPRRRPLADGEQEYPAVRLIKRYGNRRLYDFKLRRCVTVEEIAEMVRKGEDLRVQDADSGADITKRFLVQMILEEQNARQLEVLPIELLRSLMTVRGEAFTGWLNGYLEAGAKFLGRQMETATKGGATMGTVYESVFPWLKNANWHDGPPPAAPGPTEPDDEKPLRAEMEELQRRMADLAAKMHRR